MDNWCWAGSAEMIMTFLGHTSPSQCEMANPNAHRTDCCTRNGFGDYPDECDRTGWPPFHDNGYSFHRTHYQALTFAQLQEQLSCKNSPVAFSRRNIVGGQPVDAGHMFVAIGYRVDPAGTNYVEVNDPSPTGNGSYLIMEYDEYVGVPGQTAHWDDFYDIKKTP